MTAAAVDDPWRCFTCGAPEDAHPFRHPFRRWSPARATAAEVAGEGGDYFATRLAAFLVDADTGESVGRAVRLAVGDRGDLARVRALLEALLAAEAMRLNLTGKVSR